jgi:ligand-binding sensor domain-containing protein/signal transduction histidine kinase/DNA-binding response OmpR family regulator
MNAFFASDKVLFFEHLSSTEGLSQSYVDCILQDHHGFLWFGTGDGLNRYDGYRFKVFRLKPFDTNSLNDNQIQSLFEDRYGIIWVGTQVGGLNSYNPATGKFTRFLHDPERETSLSDNMVFDVCASSTDPDVLWVCTNHGLNKLVIGSAELSAKKTVFQHFLHNPDDSSTLSSNFIRTVLEDHHGNLWIGTWAGLNVMDQETGCITRFPGNPDIPGNLSNEKIECLFEDHEGVLWVGTFGGGLNRFDPSTGQFSHYQHDPHNPLSLGGNKVTSMIQDTTGNYWIGTNKGLSQFRRKTRSFINYHHDPANTASLSVQGVLSLYQSPSGVIWVGTNTGGIDRFLPHEYGFPALCPGTNTKNDPQLNSIYSFLILPDAPDVLWIAMGGTLIQYDRQMNDITRYIIDSKQNPDDQGKNISSLAGDSKGKIWIGSLQGLSRFDPVTKQVFHFRHDPQNASSLCKTSRINALHMDRENPDILWIGFHSSGLGKLNMTRHTFSYFRSSFSESSTLSHNSITCITESFDGCLWIGTKKGLNCFDKTNGHCRYFLHDPDNINSLSSNYILSLYEDKDRVLWVGTDNAGLNKLEWNHTDRINGRSPKVTHFDGSDGLPNEVIYGILEDNFKHLWLSTNQGLSRFDRNTGKFRNFDRRDGLLSSEFNTGSYFKAETGELFFGGISGMNSFFPELIRDNKHIPPVVFTDFLLSNESVLTGPGKALQHSITETEKIILNNKQNVFSLEFSALDFADSRKNQYAYFLEGFDRSWNDIGTRHFITFTNLPAGSYRLRVKAANNDGLWNTEGTHINIRIKPVWWETNLAIVFLIIMIAGLFILGMRLKLNRERMRNQLKLERIRAEHLTQLDNMKSRFFANISHEFRTPLTLILGPMEQWLSGDFRSDLKKTAKRVIRNAQSLLSLVDELLNLSRLETGKLRLKAGKGDMIQQIKTLFYGFESLAGSRHISLEFSCNAPVHELYFDAKKMEKVWNNLFCNAIKFTPDHGQVALTIQILHDDCPWVQKDSSPNPGKLDDYELQIQLWNSGKGISADHLSFLFDRFYQTDDMGKANQGCGIGLALVKELVELHHGSIEVRSIEGKWTEFTLRFPMGKEHLAASEIVDTPTMCGLLKPSSQCFIAEQETTAREDTEPEQCLAEDTSRLILVIEDNPDMREYLAEILSSSGRIIQARDGAEGLKMAIHTIPSLIVSDVVMPTIDGCELCQKIKADDRTSHIPVILLTAKSTAECKMEGLKLGADDFLIKPFNSAELLLRVENLMEQRRLLHEKYQRIFQLKPADLVVESYDETFLKRCICIIEDHLEDPDLKVDWLAKEVGLSRSQLHRKLHALLGQTSSSFIRHIRLKRAALLLKKDFASVSEIMYSVGFNSAPYFRKCFREHYGVNPSEYHLKQN